MFGYKRLRTAWVLRRHAIDDVLWKTVSSGLAPMQRLSSTQMAHLRSLATQFLHEKRFSAARGFELTPQRRLIIAIQAVLPILSLDLSLYRGWSEVIVYADLFKVTRTLQDDNGVVHLQQEVLAGESWSQGPVILSWSDIEFELAHPGDGHNVVIHELAHKLDALNGRTNGMPPLHAEMRVGDWSESFGEAYNSLLHSLDDEGDAPIDSYAAESPAEFFAVVSEYFFTAPEILRDAYPRVYQQLSRYYRQTPIAT
jgi:Mlc titration factor MtfA (ptsG expression regulator)